MKKHFPDKSREHQSKLTQITEVILACGKNKIAFVILFGSFARGTAVYDSYIEGGTTYVYASDYDILIITKTKKDAAIGSAIKLKTKIKKQLDKNGLDRTWSPSHSVNLIIESIDKVNCELEKDQYFFSDIKKQGILLYDCGEFELSTPKELSLIQRKKIAREDYQHWFGKANEFLDHYLLDIEKNYLSTAAFHLHQATESFYHCAILVSTGYKHKTHDLNELGKFSSSQSNKFLTIFPKATEDQKKCFELLQSAYIDARYSKDYLITKTQLEYLIEKVEKLREVVAEICAERI